MASIEHRRLPRAFFARDARIVARELLGAFLVCQLPRRCLVGRIVETEAYGGRGDRASHAFRGKTKRNAVMFGPPGHAYVYFTYGMHWLLNVVCEVAGAPAAVLIRGVELLPSGRRHTDDTELNGPAKLTKALRITGALNSEDLVKSRRLWIAHRQPEAGRRKPERIVRTPRIGVAYAGHAARWKRRYLFL